VQTFRPAATENPSSATRNHPDPPKVAQVRYHQRPHRGLQPARQTGQTRRVRVPESRQFGTPDTISLHPQTAGRNPDVMLIARSKSKSRYGGLRMTSGGPTVPPGLPAVASGPAARSSASYRRRSRCPTSRGTSQFRGIHSIDLASKR